jgi:quercetin dioxygenase-like cupin family protein
MDKISLAAVASEELQAARDTSSGRASKTVYGDRTHSLRQTVIAMVGGAVLNEHDSPGEATVFVLQGRVELSAADDVVSTGVAGDLLIVPGARHALAAREDSVVVLTVALRH